MDKFLKKRPNPPETITNATEGSARLVASQSVELAKDIDGDESHETDGSGQPGQVSKIPRRSGCDAADERCGLISGASELSYGSRPSDMALVNVNDEFTLHYSSSSKPNHAHQSYYPEQQLGNKTRRFQNVWYTTFSWLHKEAATDGVLCFFCAQAGEQSIAKNSESAFVSSGFKNWNRARETFLKHESSCAHKSAIAQWLQRKKPIAAQLSTKHAADQLKARNCLVSLLKCLRFLARQGLPLRGHDETESNYSQLRSLCADFDAPLHNWLNRYHDYCSPEIQNEMLNLMSTTIIRAICQEIRQVQPSQPAVFSVIVDGTKDISGTEQESVCLRYVSLDLQPMEVFLGFYETSSTSGDSLSRIVLDVLERLGLPLAQLRGQTYDGASNMSGKYNGTQARIKEKQPLAIFVHCSTHCVNLVTETAILSTPCSCPRCG